MQHLTVDNISQIEADYDEEESYSFLQYYQLAKDWYVYDSHELGIETVKHLSNQFLSFHGKIPFPQEKLPSEFLKSYWSSLPIALFKFKLLADQSFYLVKSVKKVDGYIVEGAYWENGFCYIVRDDNKIIQVKLFLDKKTKEEYYYPDKHLI
jgi:hypothetical protein